MTDTILAEGKGKPIKEWPGLFSLYRNADGSFRAEFGAETLIREWALRWKLDEREIALATALGWLSAGVAELDLVKVPELVHYFPFGGSNAHEIHRAAQDLRSKAGICLLLLNKLTSAFGDDLKTITNSNRPRSERFSAKKKIERRVGHALDAMIAKGSRKTHGRATTRRASFGTAPLAWFTLEATRKLVEKKHELPTKGQVKAVLMKSDKELSRVSTSQWAEAFKDAGLATLPRSSTRKLASQK